ncbi:hypothetical protein IR145_06735, partial [Streptococcus danieliae]|nr:hypothetical protein [Streptococcus danieliae]
MKIIKLLGVLLAGGLILNACASSKDNVEVKTSGENKSEEASKTKKPDYEIKEVKVENDGFAIYVTGVLTNNTDSEKSYVQVSIPAYDE